MSLRWKPRLADGVLAGLHRSPRHGRSVEFADHKVYTPGDDTRHVDWRAFARSDRFYVKRFLDETSLRAFLICDTSASMAYGGGHDRSLPGVRKADYARTLCASLAWLLIRQADAVGLMTFADEAGPRTAIRWGERQLSELLDALERATLGGGTRPAQALAVLATGPTTPRGLVEVIYASVDRVLWSAAEASTRALVAGLVDEGVVRHGPDDRITRV
jgi:uncharacterized protein (DUF58 family)